MNYKNTWASFYEAKALILYTKIHLTPQIRQLFAEISKQKLKI